MVRSISLGAAGAILCISAASAHVTLEKREATVGASYKAVLRVPHGCDGSATTALRVRVPDGYVGVKPMPKAGWTLSTVNGKYNKAYTLRGTTLTEGVTEVSWTGGKLPDAFYDEFVLTGTITDALPADSTIYFKVVQECEKGVHRWIEVPAAGRGHESHGQGGSEPAPGLTLLPKR
jgi:uncharacterized protein YcnI